jgi:prephenate dehydrogenase
MTRLAGSQWSVWRDIVTANSHNIVEAIDGYIEHLVELRSLTARGEGEGLLEPMQEANAAWARVSTAVPA